MAEGYLRHFARNNATVYSAGIETHGLNKQAVATMLADGIDISHHTSNNVSEYRHLTFDYVITVCDHARENCPWFPAEAKAVHRSFTDPSKVTGSPQQVAGAFAEVRDEIKEFCRQFAAEML